MAVLWRGCFLLEKGRVCRFSGKGGSARLDESYECILDISIDVFSLNLLYTATSI
jgi:hypothetical protein